MNLPRLASLVFNRPHYITRDAGLAIANVVTRGALAPEANRFVGEQQYEKDKDGYDVRWRGYRMFGATAIVNVLGELVNRGAWLDARSGLISYEGFAQQLRSAARDPRAKRILLDVNSPGGEAAGMTDIAALVRAIAAEKPVIAVANSMMCSAAYGLCSGATRIVTTDLGVVGSIGVVMMHADYSGALDKAGIAVTLIHEGEHKVDGNPFEALPEAVRDDYQAECAKYYKAFVDCVAMGRTGLDAAAIRATEARTYLGREAVDVGLADDVGTFDQVLEDLESSGVTGTSRLAASSASQRTRTAQQGDQPVTTKAASPATETQPAQSETPPAKTYSQAELDAAVAQATAAGTAQGRASERARVKGILGSAAAEGRADLATHLAFDTDMAADAATSMLEKAPKAAAAVPAAASETMMGLELAQPAATKSAAVKPFNPNAVYERRKQA